jgi:hypothetical protein
MAEKVIGLRIQLNGFNGVITSIKQLEEELVKAKQDLNELEIGSNNFKTLQGEISRTETKLQGLRKASEGIGLEKQLEGYGKLAGGITSSFAAAQAAVALFGNESTLVAEAAAQAQNLLTLALAARGIQEVAVGAQIVARTVAEKAATAATLTTNTALKALYTTIAANPIGALVTAIGLLVGAVIAFSSETKKAINVQKELGKVTSDEASKLKVYGRILTDVNSTNRQRKEVVDELKKTYPGFNALIDKENRLNEDGKKFLDAKIKSLVLEAQTKLIVQKIAENNNKIIEEENKTVEESITGWQKFTNTLLGGVSVYGSYRTAILNGEDAIKNQKEAIKDINQENEQWYNSLKNIFEASGLVDDTLDPINAKLKAQAQAEADLAKNTNEAAKATDAQVASQKRLQAQLSLVEQTYQTTLERIKELVNISSIKVDAPQIIKQLEDIVSARKALVPDTIVDVFDKLGITIRTFNGQIIGLYDAASRGNKELKTLGSQLGDTVSVLSDEFGIFYDKVREDLSIKSLSQSVVDFGSTVDTVLNQAAEKFKAGEITKEAFDAFRGITDQYRKFNELIQSTPGVEKIFNQKSLQEFLEVQRKIGVATGVIKYEYDNVTGVISEVNKEGIDYAASVKLQNDQIKQYTESLVQYYTSQYDATTKSFNQTVNLTNLTKEQRKELNEAAAEGGTKIQEVILQISQTQAQGLKTLVETIVEEETNIRDFLFQAQELAAQARALDAVSIKQGLLNNLKLVYDATQKENKIIIDAKKTQSQQLIALENDLKAKGIDISKLTEEEKLKILKFYLEEQVKATADAEALKQEEFKKTIDNLNLALQTISKALSDVASLVAQSFQIQLDTLEYRYQEAMDNIVGDTEEANQKRVETEKAYQAEKAQIERKAQLASLRFTLASAIAAGAQAIVTALTLPPPASFIIAGLNAGITAVQVGLIQTQISDLQSRPLRRGGLLSMGGYISGPSHEQGGVYAGGGYTLEGNESVINRQSTLQYSGLLSQINQSGGGRPIVVQSPMDSRLVEALAKQKTEPIRAYVVEQDITRAQTINRRLEQLASF